MAHSKRQLAAAHELGIPNPEELTSQQLSNAIAASPATKAQVGLVTELLTAMGQQAPVELTYGEAGRILDQVAPLVNEQKLLERGWEAGTIVAWRDGYYRICKVHPDFRFTLKRVELVRASPDVPAEVHETVAEHKVHNPFTLHGEQATAVDLNTVQL